MQYKVPQNVEREDQIVGPLTLRQLIIVAIGGGISYVIYVNLAKTYELNAFELFLVAIPGIISAAFAFVKIKDLTMPRFLACFTEMTLKARQRYWIPRAGDVIISPSHAHTKTKKEQKDAIEKPLSKLERLNHLLEATKAADSKNNKKDIDDAEDEELLHSAFFHSTGNHQEHKARINALADQAASSQ